VTLAESMDSRGFARDAATGRERAAGWCGGLGLLALAGAFVALIGRESAIAVALVVGGGVALVGAVVLVSRSSTRVRYRPRRLTGGDLTVMLGVIAAPVLLAVASIAGDDSLVWTASPLRWPEFHVLPALALVPLCVPLVAATRLFERSWAPEAPRSPERALAGPP
jgi:hypothetical protein